MKRDFSDSAYNELISLVNEVENEKWCDFTDWIGDGWYGFQEWLGVLNISHYIDNVNSYHKKVIDKNNASKSTIDTIFANVKNIDRNYATRFAAYKTCLEQFNGLIGQFTAVVSPANGSFNPGELGSYISTYENEEKYLKIIGGEGLSQTNIDEMDDITMATIVAGITSTVVDLLPSVKVGEQLEIPVGPGAAIYYSVNADIRGNSDFDVNLIAEDQKIKFKNISYSTDSDGALSFGVEGNTDEEVSVSVSSDRTSFSINNSGELEGSATMKVGKDTYTVKGKMSLEEVSFEESIKTEDEVGSITSTIGIKKKNDNGWTPLPVPAVEPEPIQLPQFEAPDINWGYVAAGVVAGVIIAGAIVLAPETGGASLVALAAV